MSHPWFDKIVLFLIAANSVCLALADPLKPTNNTLEFIESIFNVLFTIEMIIKMISLGIRGSELSYFSDNWNKMDFCVGKSNTPMARVQSLFVLVTR